MNKTDITDQKIVHDFEDYNLCRDALLYYSDSKLFFDEDARYEDNIYKRKLRPHILKYLDYSKPLDTNELSNYSALSINRVLSSMYEQDFLILPENFESEEQQRDFETFYSQNRKSAANCAIPFLEKYLFSFLSEEIKITGEWNLETVCTYFENYNLSRASSDHSKSSVDYILDSSDPLVSAQDFLIQLAPDFLLESSPMARYASGSYGRLGSNLFKIIIDELGYGVYEKKHSVLFQNTLQSVGLESNVHTYWQYYLNGSLLLSNYYNMITRDKSKIFRYIGAIYQAETAFIKSCFEWKTMLEKASPKIDTKYFAEHIHIDNFHSKMVLESLVIPAIKAYGKYAANEIIRGFEEAIWLSEFAENDLRKQIEWKSNADIYQGIHDELFPKIKDIHAEKIEKQTFIEPAGELSVTHSHDDDELCHINSGTMEYLNGFGKSTILNKGEGIIIKNTRLHGALIQSKECNYSIYTLGDHRKWQ